MKHSFFSTIAMLFLGVALCHAQGNLVPNPSFEQLTDCNIGSLQIFKAAPWYSPFGSDHDSITLGAIFNRCSPLGTSGNVPFPGIGIDYQEPHSGDGYAGMVLNGSPGANFRNNIGVTLLDTLTVGQCYFVSLFVNNADDFHYGSNNMGLLFSDTPRTYADNLGGFIPANPQVMAYGNPVIADTQHWVQIAAVYIAQGTETNILIGDFFDDSTLDTVNIQEYGQNGAGYFIDDVSVTPIDSIASLPLAGPDTSVVQGDSVAIGTLFNGITNMQWYDAAGSQISAGVPQIKVKPTASTFYTVQATICGKVFTDTVQVMVQPVGVMHTPKQSQLQFYPNPASDRLTVVLPEGHWQLLLTNMQGQLVSSTDNASGTMLLHLSLPQGTYFLQAIEKASGASITKSLSQK